MNELGPSERRLLSALHEADEPAETDRERVRGAVLARIAVAGGAAAATTTATAKAAAAGTLLTAPWKAVIAVSLLAAAGGGGAWWVAQTRDAEPAQPPTAATPVTQPRPVSAAPTEPVDPTPTPAASDGTDGSESPPVPARRLAQGRTEPKDTGADLDREVQLLGEAQQAMKQGDADRALRLLDSHAAEHPSGVLSTERLGVRAIALCQSGKLSQGRTAARAFLAQNPKSPLSARIRAACFGKND